MAKFGKDAPNLRDLKRRREVIGQAPNHPTGQVTPNPLQ